MCKQINTTTLKYSTYTSCILNFIFGCIIIWIGFLVSSSTLIQSLGYSYAGFLVIACGLVQFSLGFLGFLGMYKEKKHCIRAFICLSFLVGCLLLIGGSLVLYVREISGKIFMSEETCLEHFQNVNNLSIYAGEVMCSLYCPCSVKKNLKGINLDIAEGSAINSLECNPCENIQTYTSNKQEQIINWINTTLGYTVNATSCAITPEEYQNSFFPSEDIKYINMIMWMEEKFSCSGMCTKQDFLLFTDVNKNTPNEACYHQIRYWAHENMQGYGAAFLIFGVFQILSGIIGIVYQTKKKILVVLPTNETTKQTVYN